MTTSRKSNTGFESTVYEDGSEYDEPSRITYQQSNLDIENEGRFEGSLYSGLYKNRSKSNRKSLVATREGMNRLLNRNSKNNNLHV
jgi:hypothetical protein